MKCENGGYLSNMLPWIHTGYFNIYRDRRLLEDLRSVTHLRLTQCLHFLPFATAASYEIYLPPNLGLRADGGLCFPH